jgi:hypothetical protein
MLMGRGNFGQSDYGLDDQGSIPGKGKNFFFATASGPVLGPIHPPIQWVTVVIP